MKQNVAFLTALVIMVSQCGALEVSINCDDEFHDGDFVFFNYTFESEEDMNITFVPYVECPEMPNALLYEDTAEIKAGIAYTGSYFYGTVGAFPPQECEASLYVVETEQMEAKTLKIATDSVFEFRLMTCADSSCDEEMPVFIKGEIAYISFESDAGGIETECVMTHPDGTEEIFSIPHSFAVESSGVYRLEADASKSGFQPNGDSIQFAVIDKEPETIREETICNNNLFCETERGETQENCPLDCEESAIVSSESGLKGTLIISLGIILIGAAAFYLYRKKSSSR